MPSLRDLVEATLEGRDERLVARCDVEGILKAFEQYGICDVESLAEGLESAFGALQVALEAVAPPIFLALVKAKLRSQAQSETASPAPPSIPSRRRFDSVMRVRPSPSRLGSPSNPYNRTHP